MHTVSLLLWLILHYHIDIKYTQSLSNTKGIFSFQSIILNWIELVTYIIILKGLWSYLTIVTLDAIEALYFEALLMLSLKCCIGMNDHNTTWSKTHSFPIQHNTSLIHHSLYIFSSCEFLLLLYSAVRRRKNKRGRNRVGGWGTAETFTTHASSSLVLTNFSSTHFVRTIEVNILNREKYNNEYYCINLSSGDKDMLN